MEKNKTCHLCGQAFYIGDVILNNEAEEQEYIIKKICISKTPKGLLIFTATNTAKTKYEV